MTVYQFNMKEKPGQRRGIFSMQTRPDHALAATQSGDRLTMMVKSSLIKREE
jgi:hypothetical protein